MPSPREKRRRSQRESPVQGELYLNGIQVAIILGMKASNSSTRAAIAGPTKGCVGSLRGEASYLLP